MHLDPAAPLRNSTGSGRPYPPEIVASVRSLVEGPGLSYREAAARSGLREDTVGRWARRFGWRRAGVGGAAPDRLARDTGPTPGVMLRRREASSRSTRERCASFETQPAAAPQDDAVGSSRPDSERRGTRRPRCYGPEVLAAARARIEGTRIGMERIGLELGVARWTLYGWQKRFGWRRPDPPDRIGPNFYRSRRFGRAYGGDAVGTARDLVLASDLPLVRIAARAGVCPAAGATPPSGARKRRSRSAAGAGGPTRIPSWRRRAGCTRRRRCRHR